MTATGHIEAQRRGRHRPQPVTPVTPLHATDKRPLQSGKRPLQAGKRPLQNSATAVAGRWSRAKTLVPIRVLIWALFLSIAAAALWVTMHVHTERSVFSVALFVHVVSLVVGFGAVLSVDFQAGLWLLGRRKLADVVRFGSATHALIWIGLTGLVLSGALLHPNLSSGRTKIKLVLVLVVALNGFSVLGILDRLERAPGGRLPAGLLVRAAVAVLISQGGWWGATAIGFLNAQATSPTVQRAPGLPAKTGGLHFRTGQAGTARISAPPTSPPSKPAGSRKATARTASERQQRQAVVRYPAARVPAPPTYHQQTTSGSPACRILDALRRAGMPLPPSSSSGYPGC
jgi:hypothetical protein